MMPTATDRRLDLLPGELEIVREILRRHVPEREVWAFGSRVKGKARPYSDLDITILGDERLPLSTRANLAEDFSESDLPFKVDIGDWAITSERFRQIIESEYVALPLDQTVEEGKKLGALGYGV
ncbi:MAG: nucleotidyltransferase domain-containing protein [Terracidiphilus sp.]|jgi:predicted nucleotidyltransferase